MTNNRKIVLIILAILNIFILVACTKNKDASVFESNKELMLNVENDGFIKNEEDLQKEDSNMIIDVQIGEHSFTGVLYNNPSTHEFLKRLPINLNMFELNGNEKYYNMSDGLPTNSQRVGKINKGDIMLYGSDCLVLFYESFSTPYSYTKIGYIKNPNGLEDALGKGSVEITFDKSE